jgi:hypothetical protein
MRDPLENKAWRPQPAAYWADPAKGAPGDPGHPETNYWQLTAWAAEIWDQAHLLAFTVDADDYLPEKEVFSRGWARARMWEQYGEDHSGVCLVFDQARLTAAIEGSLQSQELAMPYHHAVEYAESGKDELVLGADMLSGEITTARVAAYIEANPDTLFFLKARDWRSEYEYRFVVTTPPGEGLFVDYADSLVAVIGGEKFPDWQIPGARGLTEIQDAQALRLHWDNQPFLIDLRQESERPW